MTVFYNPSTGYKFPDYTRGYNTLLNILNKFGHRDSDIAKSLGCTRQYVSLLRTKRTPPKHIMAALRKLVMTEYLKQEAEAQAEADSWQHNAGSSNPS